MPSGTSIGFPKKVPPPMDQSCVLYYKMDEASGDIKDWSVNNNTGKATDLTYSQTGKFGTACLFNGTTSFVDGGNGASLNFERTDPFTISIWASLISLTGSDDDLISKMDANSPFRGYTLTLATGGVLIFYLINSYSSNCIKVTFDGTYLDSVMRNYVVVYDGSSDAHNIKCYVNGVNTSFVVGYDSLSGTTQTAVNLNIGRRQNSRYLNATIDEVRIYNRALTASEVKQLYMAGR